MSAPPAVPTALTLPGDQTLKLLRRGYRFFDELGDTGAEVVRMRLMGRRATVVRGEEGARLFYTEPSLRRAPALPELVVGSLFGHGAVHTLDGAGHHHRKALFTSLATPAASARVVADLTQGWEGAVDGWEGTVDLHEEVSLLILRAGCRWLGLALDPTDGRRRAADMVAMVDGFGSVGARQVRARLARARSELWVAGQLRERRERGTAGPGGADPLDVVAGHRDLDGDLLPLRVAAVETLNLLRPLVAVTWLVSSGVRALDDLPELRRRLAEGEVSSLWVAQEVRRVYPFAPALAATPGQDLVWRGVDVPAGSLLVLNVWATDHDPVLWPRPDVFDPDRFATQTVTPWNLLPQGGGAVSTGHRCPGEDLTLSVLATLLRALAASGVRVGSSTAVRLDRMPPDPSCLVRVGPARTLAG
ncbi:cytochrome P450 [Auraticoccus monumenti]|nr:cytochrome P450 [Auraticoccus monumenti]